MNGLMSILVLVLGVFILGLIIAFCPSLYITEVAILKKSKKPFIHSLALISGVVVALLIYTFIFGFIVDPSVFQPTNIIKDIFSKPIINILIGVVLLGASYQLVREKRESVVAQNGKDHDKLFYGKSLFWLGLIRTLTRISSLAAILIFLEIMETYYPGKTLPLLVGLMFIIVVAISPLIATAALERFSPKTYNKLLRLVERMESYNWELTLKILFLFGGIYFIFLGIKNL